MTPKPLYWSMQYSTAPYSLSTFDHDAVDVGLTTMMPQFFIRQVSSSSHRERSSLANKQERRVVCKKAAGSSTPGPLSHHAREQTASTISIMPPPVLLLSSRRRATTTARQSSSSESWPRHLVIFLFAILLVIAFSLVLTYRMAYLVEHPDHFYKSHQTQYELPLWSLSGQQAYVDETNQVQWGTPGTASPLTDAAVDRALVHPPRSDEIRAQQQERSRSSDRVKVKDPNSSDNRHLPEGGSPPEPSASKIHLVFSTGCSLRQDWQSYAFFYHAWQHQPNAHVTRIASGCTNETLAQQLFDIYIHPMAPHKFHLHLTPEYGNLVTGQTYKFFNKPFGLLHWMQHELRLGDTNNSPHRNDMIILMDPDQLLIRPFGIDYTHETELYPPGPQLHRQVSHGRPMAQRYGFGTHFTRSIRLERLVRDIHNATLIPQQWLSNPRPWELSHVEFHYTVGPPYLATGHDWWSLVQLWAATVVPLYRQTKHDFMAEMYAYSVAAWILNRPHQLVNSFMVSNVDSSGEAWPWIDGWENEDQTAVCDVNTTLPLPHVLHFCQRYHQGPWFFSKYNLPTDFVSCHHPLLKVPTGSDDLLHHSTSRLIDGQPVLHIPLLHRKRHSFMLCHLLQRMNQVARYYKDHHCPRVEDGSDTATNYSESYVWPQFVNQPLPLPPPPPPPPKAAVATE